LLVIATAQLMLVLDDTIANIALPSIQADLNVSASSLPWVINAYLLAFGGLLLFGGRAGDLFGRRRVFRVGLAVFTLASLLGGLAPSGELLIAARGLQGIGAALTAPNALALIATTFAAGKARNGAMAVYGAMSALGITGGVLLGGVLTGALDWRWVFLINLPIGLAVLAGTRTLVEAERNTGRLDTLGAITGTSGMMALAFAITRGGEHGWADAVTVGAFVVAAILLTLFLIVQARSAHPLLPLRLLQERNRSGSYATMLFIGAGLMGTFFLGTVYMQHVLHFSPVRTGVAWLPFAVGIVVASALSSKLVERLAPRAVAVPGLLVAAAGMYWLSLLEAGSAYSANMMLPIFITSAGLGMAFVPLTLSVVQGVDKEVAGTASALLNAAQQLGAALGLSLLTTVSTSAADGKLPQAAKALYAGLAANDRSIVAKAAEALTHGYTTALLVGAGMLLVAALVTAVAVNTRRTQSGAASGAESPSAA
jgi:EmrB/QacA subfamily drug resistance transporter